MTLAASSFAPFDSLEPLTNMEINEKTSPDRSTSALITKYRWIYTDEKHLGIGSLEITKRTAASVDNLQNIFF